MTTDQIKVEALLKVAQQQLRAAADQVDLLSALNRGNDMPSFRDISNDTAKHLEAATVALMHAHNACYIRATGMSQSAQLGGMN